MTSNHGLVPAASVSLRAFLRQVLRFRSGMICWRRGRGRSSSRTSRGTTRTSSAPCTTTSSCSVYQHKAAARRLEDCLRAHGRITEADILQEHNERLAAELEYLESLGVQAA